METKKHCGNDEECLLGPNGDEIIIKFHMGVTKEKMIFLRDYLNFKINRKDTTINNSCEVPKGFESNHVDNYIYDCGNVKCGCPYWF